MKNKSIRIFLVLAVAIIGFSAFGCGGIPMPDKEDNYSTWVEKVRLPEVKELEEVEDLDIVHINFTIKFKKSDKVSLDELKSYLKDCSSDGSCGTTARLSVEGKYKQVSNTCKLGEIDDSGTEYNLPTSCQVPIEGGMKEGKTYRLKLITISPDLTPADPLGGSEDNGSISPKHDLVFTSSPKFEVIDKKFVFTKVFVQQQ